MAVKNDDRVKQAKALEADGMSRREIARVLGTTAPTIGRWLGKSDKSSEEAGPVGEDESRVAELLLDKAEKLLLTITDPDLSAAQKQAVATAIEKLLGKYLNLVGKPDEQHVVVEGGSNQDLEDALQKFLRKPVGRGEASTS